MSNIIISKKQQRTKTVDYFPVTLLRNDSTPSTTGLFVCLCIRVPSGACILEVRTNQGKIGSVFVSLRVFKEVLPNEKR